MNKEYLTKKHILFYASCFALLAAIALTIVFGCLRASVAPVSVGTTKAVSSDGADFLFISESKVLAGGEEIDVGALAGEENLNIVWAERRNGAIYTVTESKNIYVTVGDSVVFSGSVTGIPQSLSVSEDGNAIAVVMRSSRNYSIGFFDIKENFYHRIELDCQGQNAFIRKASEGYVIDVVKSDVEFITYSPQGEKIGRRIIDDIPLASCSDGETVYILAENNVIYAIDTDSFEIKQEISVGKDHRAIAFIASERSLIAVDYTGKLTLIDNEGRISRANGVYESTGVIVNSENDVLLKTRTGGVYATSLSDIASRSAHNIAFTVFLSLAIIFAVVCIILLFAAFKRAKTGLRRFLSGVKKHKVPVMVLLPVAVLVGFLSYYPAISGLALSFMEYKPGAYSRFAGLANFASMFRNEYFWIGFKNLFIFVVAGLIKSLIPPIIVALLIIAARSKKMQYFFRTALYLPAILPGVAGLLLWTNGIYGPSGMLNSFVTAFGGASQNWLGNPDTVIWMLILIGFPWVGSFLIFYGAFKGVPDSYHEAAMIEGAGYFKILFGIDIPMIVPQIRYVLIMSLITGVQEFSLVYFTTGGGPGNATYVPMLEIYLQVTKYQNYGVASAMGVFMFVVLFSITFVNLKLTTKKKEALY